VFLFVLHDKNDSPYKNEYQERSAQMNVTLNVPILIDEGL